LSNHTNEPEWVTPVYGAVMRARDAVSDLGVALARMSEAVLALDVDGMVIAQGKVLSWMHTASSRLSDMNNRLKDVK
jgi:hypothetical protein